MKSKLLTVYVGAAVLAGGAGLLLAKRGRLGEEPASELVLAVAPLAASEWGVGWWIDLGLPFSWVLVAFYRSDAASATRP